MRVLLSVVLLLFCAVASGDDFDLIGDQPINLIGDTPVTPVKESGALFFTAKSCGWCERMKSVEFVELAAQGWKISEAAGAHIQVIDYDLNPDLVTRWNIEVLPTTIRLKAGKEVGRRTGYQSSKDLAEWWNSFTDAAKETTAIELVPDSDPSRTNLINHLSGKGHFLNRLWLDSLTTTGLQDLYNRLHVAPRQQKTNQFLFFNWSVSE